MQQFLSALVAILAVAAIPDSASRILAEEPLDAAQVTEIVREAGERAVDTDKIVGLSIGVARGQDTLCVRGFGLANVELDVPATADTVYRIGSISKQFTAAAILLLAEREKLALDDTVGTFFEDYPDPGRDATIEQLLQHTSGIKNFTGLPAYRAEQPNNVTRDDVIDRFRDEPLDFSPGEKFKYCNSGYFLLGAIVEEASGQTFSEFVEQSLFAPSQLSQTYCDNHAQIIPNRARGYSRWAGALRNAGYLNMKQTIGAGNLASTAGDLLKWQQALNGQSLLTAESSNLMVTVGVLNDKTPTSYGLGLFVQRRNGQDVIRHGGGINGFRSELAYYPDSGYSIAVLSNGENAQATRIADSIAKQLLKTPDAPQK